VRAAFVVLAALGAANAYAQQSVGYASIGGRITDPSGAVVPGAQVAARQLETNLSSSTTADERGRFRFPFLRVGTYEISVRQAGFKDWTRRLG
jgi:hypothetical protein